MILSRLVLVFGVLFSLTLFIFSNLINIDQGSGYRYLVALFACFVLLLLSSKHYFIVFSLRVSVVPIAIFIAYYSSKFYLETGDTYSLKQLTIGTSGGIVFALVLGFIVSYTLSIIYELRGYRRAYFITYYVTLVYFLSIVYLSYEVFQYNYASVAAEKFRIDDQVSYYQRAGNLLFIQFMTAASLAVVLTTTAVRVSFTKSLFFLVLVTTMGVVFGFLSQLVGSNSGLVASAALTIIYLTHFLFIKMDSRPRSQLGRSINYTLFSGFGIKISISALVALLMLFFVVSAVIIETDFDIDTMRITGFGTGEVSSVESRAEIFQDSLLVHMSYDPIFGHSQVDVLTGGAPGSYLHSLIAIQTHSGAIGTLIFTIFILMLYREITDKKNRGYMSLYQDSHYNLYRLLVIFSVLVMCGASAFFTWQPMWFCFGLLGLSFLKQPKVVYTEPVRIV